MATAGSAPPPPLEPGQGMRRRGRPRGRRDADAPSTREQILEVALDLFTERGYGQTSLREIAERLGLTKAALYYHFSSKDEIFMALHRRLHESLDATVAVLEDEDMTLGGWLALFERFVEKFPGNRKLILMHERNRTAFEKVHNEGHDQEHADIEEKLSAALRDPEIPVRERIRIGCAFSMMMGGLLFAGDGFQDVDADELTAEMKSALQDLLGAY